MSTDPRDIAPICESIQAPVIAERGPAPLHARGGRARLLKTESGRVVTHGEVMTGLLVRSEIEREVFDGRLPEWIACETCKIPVKVSVFGGRLPKKCDKCTGKKCVECGRLRGGARGRPGPCKDCIGKNGGRSESMRKWIAENRTSEQMRTAGRAGAAALTREQRALGARNMLSSRTDAQRSDAARKASETRRAKKVNTPSDLIETHDNDRYGPPMTAEQRKAYHAWIRGKLSLEKGTAKP